MTRYMAFAIQKGGTGKTTTAANMAAILAGPDYNRVVVTIDFDGQAHLTESMLQDQPVQGTIADVIMGEASIGDIIRPSVHHPDSLFVIPGRLQLEDYIEQRLMRDGGFVVQDFAIDLRERVRADLSVWRTPDGRPAEIVIIDTPPTLGMWTKSAMVLADGVVIIGTAERMALQGAVNARDLMTEMRMYARDLALDGVVLNLWDARRVEPKSFLEQYREHFGDALIEPPIPNLSIIASTGTFMTPVESLKIRGANTGTEIYRDVLAKLLRRVERGEGQVAPQQHDNASPSNQRQVSRADVSTEMQRPPALSARTNVQARTTSAQDHSERNARDAHDDVRNEGHQESTAGIDRALHADERAPSVASHA